MIKVAGVIIIHESDSSLTFPFCLVNSVCYVHLAAHNIAPIVSWFATIDIQLESRRLLDRHNYPEITNCLRIYFGSIVAGNCNKKRNTSSGKCRFHSISTHRLNNFKYGIISVQLYGLLLLGFKQLYSKNLPPNTASFKLPVEMIKLCSWITHLWRILFRYIEIERFLSNSAIDDLIAGKKRLRIFM